MGFWGALFGKYEKGYDQKGRQYSSGVSEDSFAVKVGPIVFIGIILLPVWLIGMSASFALLKFLRQPFIYGYVPLWAVILGVILVFVYFNKKD